jgi:hypothetical protein
MAPKNSKATNKTPIGKKKTTKRHLNNLSIEQIKEQALKFPRIKVLNFKAGNKRISKNHLLVGEIRDEFYNFLVKIVKDACLAVPESKKTLTKSALIYSLQRNGRPLYC